MLADLTFALGSVCFSAALVPALRQRKPPPFSSCALTAFWLWAFVAAYLSLHLYLSAVTTGLLALMWTRLGMQAVDADR